MAESRLIESVGRALDILEILDKEGEQGITSMARKLGMEKSTVYRIVHTLCVRHYVRQNPDNSRYYNSYKIFEMGQNVARNTGLPKMAFKFMRNLAANVKGAVNLGIREDLRVVYIDQIESDETIKVCFKIGQAIPLYCTALGKSLICSMPENEIRALLSKETFIKFTPNTIETVDELLANLESVRSLGYSLDSEEHIMGIICVAAPVFNALGEPIVALSVSIPAMVQSDKNYLNKIGQSVFESANEFTQSIGGRKPH